MASSAPAPRIQQGRANSPARVVRGKLQFSDYDQKLIAKYHDFYQLTGPDTSDKRAARERIGNPSIIASSKDLNKTHCILIKYSQTPNAEQIVALLQILAPLNVPVSVEGRPPATLLSRISIQMEGETISGEAFLEQHRPELVHADDVDVPEERGVLRERTARVRMTSQMVDRVDFEDGDRGGSASGASAPPPPPERSLREIALSTARSEEFNEQIYNIAMGIAQGITDEESGKAIRNFVEVCLVHGTEEDAALQREVIITIVNRIQYAIRGMADDTGVYGFKLDEYCQNLFRLYRLEERHDEASAAEDGFGEASAAGAPPSSPTTSRCDKYLGLMDMTPAEDIRRVEDYVTEDEEYFQYDQPDACVLFANGENLFFPGMSGQAKAMYTETTLAEDIGYDESPKEPKDGPIYITDIQNKERTGPLFDVVAMAAPDMSTEKRYTRDLLSKTLSTAIDGFLTAKQHGKRTIHTSWWGCGIFLGDKIAKPIGAFVMACIQIAAARMAGVRLVFHAPHAHEFGDAFTTAKGFMGGLQSHTMNEFIDELYDHIPRE